MKLAIEEWNAQRESALRNQQRAHGKQSKRKIEVIRRRKRALLAAALLASASMVEAAPVTINVPAPTQYTDATALPAANRIGAQLYCGTVTGRYTQAWGVESAADVVSITADVRAKSKCAVTYLAKSADGTGARESDFSVEFPIDPITSAVPLNISVTFPNASVCTITCAVTRSR